MSEPDTPRQSIGALCDLDRVFDWIESRVEPLGAERVPVRAAFGGVAAADVPSPTTVPDRPRAASDGYALSAAQTIGASTYNPLSFSIDSSGEGRSPSREPRAWRVNVGDPMPPGSDAVLDRDSADLLGRTLQVSNAVAVGDNVDPPGRESVMGDSLIAAGQALRVQEIGLLELAGVESIDVVRAPSLRLVCMRDRETDRVSNMLGALLMQLGCRISGVVHAAGRRDAFAGALTVGGADAVIGIGGTGQGWNDEAVDVLVAVGEIAFHGIGLHPGETTAVGYVEGRPVVLLPGMPLAAFVGADLIAARLVRRLSGASGERFRATWRGVLTRKVSSRLGRVEICRVRCEGDLVEPIAVADGSTLATAVRADGFIAIPASSEGVGAGEEVSVILYDCNP